MAAIFLKICMLLSNVHTLRKIGSNFGGLLRKSELYERLVSYVKHNVVRQKNCKLEHGVALYLRGCP